MDVQNYSISFCFVAPEGGWSSWSNYGSCDVNCIKQRSRFCMDPNDKTSCPSPTSTRYIRYGVDMQKSQCTDNECKSKYFVLSFIIFV